MFNRIYIKETAKKRMSGWMGNAILVGFIALLLGGMTNHIGFNFSFSKDSMFQRIFYIMLPFLIGISFVAIAYKITVGNVIHIGARGWYLRYWRGEYPPIGELFAGFRIYTPSLTTGLLRDVYVFLWSLLLVIPGIVKAYAYSMSSYIIYENPNLAASQALDISERMTNGYKGSLFIFDLSYFGWFVLTALTLGILGIVYVNPYIYTAHAGVYETLKYNALQNGTVLYEEFGMAPPPAANGGYNNQTY